ncbi:MAG: restriction endonuclease subunit S [Enterococcus sp.]|uniref:restriction endonuclease subunit S n=1 Tax=Enterococcus sp. TaxID=35783 RepID=UPI002FCA09C9
MRYKLSDVVDIIGGGTPKRSIEEYWNGNIPWISIKDFSTSRWIEDTIETITDLGLNHSSTKILNKDDLIISARGTVGLVAQLKKEMAFNQSCYGLKAKKDILLNEYLYYWLKQNITYIKNNVHGSVFDTITRDTFDSLVIEVPELVYQKKVVSLLSPLDSKIELNNQMIATLEELAAVLFKRWFVDFEFPDENGNPYKSSGGKMMDSELGEIPEGWEVSQLKNIATIIMGQSPKGASYNTEGKGLPLINGASDFKNGIITPQKFTTEPKKVTQSKDLIFGVRATIGGTVEVEREYAIGRGAGIARAKEVEFREYLFLTMNKLFNFFSETATGSVYINISRKDFEDYGLVRPSSTTIEFFHKLMEPIFNQISDSRMENNNLTILRDTLLPKLLSGDIEV